MTLSVLSASAAVCRLDDPASERCTLQTVPRQRCPGTPALGKPGDHISATDPEAMVRCGFALLPRRDGSAGLCRRRSAGLAAPDSIEAWAGRYLDAAIRRVRSAEVTDKIAFAPRAVPRPLPRRVRSQVVLRGPAPRGPRLAGTSRWRPSRPTGRAGPAPGHGERAPRLAVGVHDLGGGARAGSDAARQPVRQGRRPPLPALEPRRRSAP